MRARTAGTVIRFVVRSAIESEYSEAGLVTYAGFGHAEPGAEQPTPDRLALLLGAAERAAGGDLLVAVDDSDDDSRGDAGGDPARIVGTASLLRPDSPLTRQSRDGEAELRLLAVLPEARRRGIGEALMVEAIERARSWDAPALVLDTGPLNERSQRLYERLGFIRVRERETRLASRGGYLVVYRLAFDGS